MAARRSRTHIPPPAFVARKSRPGLFFGALVAAIAVASPLVAGGRPPAPDGTTGRVAQDAAAAQVPRLGSLDAFMSRVLERRDQAWKKLHDYVLSETERFALTGPAGIPLHGMRREFAWYVRDGYLIRSPVRFDGVAIGEADRRKYEDNWLREEKTRESRRARRAAQSAENDREAPAANASGDDPATQGFVDQRGEPRFISEAFFLRFRFEPGNYYLAGRERLDGRDVVRIEYYPTRLFGGRRDRRANESRQSDQESNRIERDLNKVALVTMWIDPIEFQVVRYKFDNVDFGFLPARWLVRVDTITASMTMGRVLDGVWLPREITANGSVTLATGSFGFQYGREFYDYKKAETSAKIRGYEPPK